MKTRHKRPEARNQGSLGTHAKAASQSPRPSHRPLLRSRGARPTCLCGLALKSSPYGVGTTVVSAAKSHQSDSRRAHKPPPDGAGPAGTCWCSLSGDREWNEPTVRTPTNALIPQADRVVTPALRPWWLLAETDRLTCIGRAPQEGLRGAPDSAPCPLIAAGFCERAARVKGRAAPAERRRRCP